MDFIPILIFLAGAALGYWIAIRLVKNKNSAGSNSELKGIDLKSQNIALQKDVEHLNQRIENSINEFKEQRKREEVLLSEKLELSAEVSAKENKIQNLEEKLTEQKQEMEKMQKHFSKEFKLIADSILKQNSKEFSEAHQKELNEILSPLKEKIKSFEENINQKYNDELKERSYLKKELEQLLKLNQTLNEQAENLSTALKGENKTQGNWGELVLERILESSGLIKGQEYEVQYSDTNNENKRIQADVIVRLPDDKHIVIDSKVSLVAYEKLILAEDEAERENQLKLHLTSIKSHIKNLSEKNYQTASSINSPDFVLLFIPIESSFSLAMQGDTDIYSYAWDRKVVIVSPTTLLATLRTIASVWKHERHNRNANEIAERAGRLYDKFKSFVDDMQKIDKGIASAKNAYDDAFNKLKTGKGNIIGRIENMRELGAKTTKELPKELIDSNE